MKGRIHPKRPRNDELILRLLEGGRIVVKEDHEDLVETSWGERLPRTRVYVRDERTRDGRLRLKTMHPQFGDALYFSIRPFGSRGKMVWLSARRVVWYAFNPKRTPLMVCPLDGHPQNYNRWNLCLRDQNDQNYMRMVNGALSPEDDASADCSDDEVPF